MENIFMICVMVYILDLVFCTVAQDAPTWDDFIRNTCPDTKPFPCKHSILECCAADEFCSSISRTCESCFDGITLDPVRWCYQHGRNMTLLQTRSPECVGMCVSTLASGEGDCSGIIQKDQTIVIALVIIAVFFFILFITTLLWKRKSSTVTCVRMEDGAETPDEFSKQLNKPSQVSLQRHHSQTDELKEENTAPSNQPLLSSSSEALTKDADIPLMKVRPDQASTGDDGSSGQASNSSSRESVFAASPNQRTGVAEGRSNVSQNIEGNNRSPFRDQQATSDSNSEERTGIDEEHRNSPVQTMRYVTNGTNDVVPSEVVTSGAAYRE